MSFIAVAPTVTTGDTTTINSGDFWPVIDIDQLRQAMRIDGTVTDERLCHAAISAIGEINADLNYWRTERLANGNLTLAEVPAEQINGVSIHVHAYRRAVYALTHANLIERYRSFDTTAKGSKEADELAPQISELYRDARWAVRNILGIPHTTVELI